MKQINRIVLCLALVATTISFAKVVPYISMRSQSENAARELVLWQTQINLSCQDDFYGSFSITPEYTRTFHQGKIARILFNDALSESCCKSDCVSFNVQGSAVTNRDSHALLADYFGLPLDYSSTANISPRIENILADFNLYLGLDNWVQGLYFRIHAPLVNTRWHLGFCETNINPGNMNHPTGYFNSALNGSGTTQDPYYGIDRSNLVGTFEGFVSRCEVPTIEGITFNSLANARMLKCKLKTTKLSDVQFALGLNFWQGECYHFGVNIRGAAPTGSRPNGRYLFEPIVGNGKHWEAGAGITGHWTLWRSCDECKEFDVYLDANVTHLFKARQCRTFDLCGKPLSRYMLASKMKTPAVNLQSSGFGTATYQFDNEFTTIANISTIPVDVSATVQGDIALKFAYMYNCWQIDFGYEFWGRSCEQICTQCRSCASDTCCPNTNTGTLWALKGDSFVYGFTGVTRIPIALSASEKDAKIFCGTNNFNRTNIPWELNPGVDNALLAITPISTPVVNFPGGILADAEQMYASFNAYVFNSQSTAQWDIDGAQSRGISNKLFGNIGYVWKDIDHCSDRCLEWTPYLGLGGEVEFGKIDKQCCIEVSTTCTTKSPLTVGLGTMRGGSCCDECCDFARSCTVNCCPSTCCKEKCCCTDAAISQWGVWIKGGLSFN